MCRANRRKLTRPTSATLTALVLAWVAVTGHGEEEKKAPISLADGQLLLPAPANWKKVEPRVRIIEFEFSVPKVKPDVRDGRVVVMGAGGGVQANLARWLKQFQNPIPKTFGDDDSPTKEMTIDDQKVHFLDVSGTYLDRRGPFAPATPRKNYRMLGAIIETQQLGDYFIKCYGPEKTIAANEEAFHQMLEQLKLNPDS